MKNDINFAITYKASMQKNTDDFVRKLIILSSCSLFAIAICFSSIKIYNVKLENKIVQINNEINSNNSKQSMVELTQRVNKIKKYEQDSISNKKVLDSFSIYNKTIMDNIVAQKPQDIYIDQINFANNELLLICKTVNTDSPSKFAKSLLDSNLFLKVAYNGFKIKQQENAYYFEIKCTLKEGRV